MPDPSTLVTAPVEGGQPTVRLFPLPALDPGRPAHSPTLGTTHFRCSHPGLPPSATREPGPFFPSSSAFFFLTTTNFDIHHPRSHFPPRQTLVQFQ